MSLRAVLLLLIAVALTHPAHARPDAAADLTWLCWLDTRDDFHIRCRLDEDPLASAIAADAVTAAPVDQRAILAAIFRPGSAPNIARLVREEPARYAQLVWSIPLHSMPFDDSPLRELAQSVMCGADRRCTAFLDWPLRAQPARFAPR